MGFDRDGRLIALVLGSVHVLEVDARGQLLRDQVIASDVDHLVLARDGSAYVSRGVDLYRLAP